MSVSIENNHLVIHSPIKSASAQGLSKYRLRLINQQMINKSTQKVALRSRQFGGNGLLEVSTKDLGEFLLSLFNANSRCNFSDVPVSVDSLVNGFLKAFNKDEPNSDDTNLQTAAEKCADALINLASYHLAYSDRGLNFNESQAQPLPSIHSNLNHENQSVQDLKYARFLIGANAFAKETLNLEQDVQDLLKIYRTDTANYEAYDDIGYKRAKAAFLKMTPEERTDLLEYFKTHSRLQYDLLSRDMSLESKQLSLEQSRTKLDDLIARNPSLVTARIRELDEQIKKINIFGFSSLKDITREQIEQKLLVLTDGSGNLKPNLDPAEQRFAKLLVELLQDLELQKVFKEQYLENGKYMSEMQRDDLLFDRETLATKINTRVEQLPSILGTLVNNPDGYNLDELEAKRDFYESKIQASLDQTLEISEATFSQLKAFEKEVESTEREVSRLTSELKEAISKTKEHKLTLLAQSEYYLHTLGITGGNSISEIMDIEHAAIKREQEIKSKLHGRLKKLLNKLQVLYTSDYQFDKKQDEILYHDQTGLLSWINEFRSFFWLDLKGQNRELVNSLFESLNTFKLQVNSEEEKQELISKLRQLESIMQTNRMRQSLPVRLKKIHETIQLPNRTKSSNLVMNSAQRSGQKRIRKTISLIEKYEPSLIRTKPRIDSSDTDSAYSSDGSIPSSNRNSRAFSTSSSDTNSTDSGL